MRLYGFALNHAQLLLYFPQLLARMVFYRLFSELDSEYIPTNIIIPEHGLRSNINHRRV